MPKIVKQLTEREVRAIAKQIGVHAVGGAGADGLQLRVEKSKREGFSCLWFLRYMQDGKRRKKSLGAYPEVTLEAARKAARELRARLAEGIDVKAEDQARAAERAAAEERQRLQELTVGDLLGEWLDWKVAKGEWKRGEDARIKEERRIRSNVPELLEKSAALCTIEEVADALRPIWCGKARTADRLLIHLRGFFHWCMSVKKCRERGLNPAASEWVTPLLPSASKRKQEGHYPMLSVDQLPPFMAALRRYWHLSAAPCLAFAVLTCSRSANVRAMRWDQLNKDRTLWEIDAADMKVTANGQHLVPLGKWAQAIIREQEEKRPYFESPFVFPSPRRSQYPISENRMNDLIELMDQAELAAGREGWIDREQTRALGRRRRVVQHALSRASFETWARENDQNDRAIKLSLHHAVAELKGSYDRAMNLEGKLALLEGWGDYCMSMIEPSS